jgi:signal transduction histidine kinase
MDTDRRPRLTTGSTRGELLVADSPRTNRRSRPLNLAPNLARAILVVVFGSFALIAFLRIFYQGLGPPSRIVVSIAYLIPMLWLQLYVFGRPQVQFRRPVLYTALLCQALIVYAAIAYSSAWVSLPGFLAGSVLLVLPPRLAWVAFGSIVASMAVIQANLTGGLIDIAYIAVATTITGLVVYGLTRLSSVVLELHEARIELAQMAVAQERLRFSRDLHDLLGYSLSAITLKSELTLRLVSKNPDAQKELVEILAISRKALADVRSVANGYRELSLDSESESARSLLVAADVDVTVEIHDGDLPTHLKTVLATVLREGITNVLRHSNAKRCEISMRQTDGRVWLDIVNDGVQTNRAQSDGGSGIPNLSARIADLHGQLVAGIEADGRYGLHAWAPIDAVNESENSSARSRVQPPVSRC